MSNKEQNSKERKHSNVISSLKEGRSADIVFVCDMAMFSQQTAGDVNAKQTPAGTSTRQLTASRQTNS